MLRRAICLQLLFLCLPLVSGCAGSHKRTDAPAAESTAASRLKAVDNPSYVISMGDELEVKFPYHPDFNETVEVRPDGVISLPLLQDVRAAGKTPSALADELNEAYRKELKEPRVTVIVRRFASQVAYVTGEIRNPQLVNLVGPTTLLQAIIRAGGVIGTADDSNVLVIRPDAQGSPAVTVADLGEIRKGAKADVMLQPYDVVYVPKTRIADVGDFVENYINRIIPRSVSFPFTYELHSDVDFPR